MINYINQYIFSVTGLENIMVIYPPQILTNATFSYFTFATCSSHRPRAINTNSIGGVSKKVIGFTLALSYIATRRITKE